MLSLTFLKSLLFSFSSLFSFCSFPCFFLCVFCSLFQGFQGFCREENPRLLFGDPCFLTKKKQGLEGQGCFPGKGDNRRKSARICENLRLGSVCPLRFVPFSAPWKIAVAWGVSMGDWFLSNAGAGRSCALPMIGNGSEYCFESAISEERP